MKSDQKIKYIRLAPRKIHSSPTCGFCRKFKFLKWNFEAKPRQLCIELLMGNSNIEANRNNLNFRFTDEYEAVLEVARF
ncbi:MAG: hypothetical protein B0W54_22055 [Cellvibrio sp. 79]|nr:MAG: hypothetical protein B0W54_22055 [Cellvibrio sp. 79]